MGLLRGPSNSEHQEAIRILSQEGLVRRNLHRGVAVCPLSLKDLHEIWQLRRITLSSAKS